MNKKIMIKSLITILISTFLIGMMSLCVNAESAGCTTSPCFKLFLTPTGINTYNINDNTTLNIEIKISSSFNGTINFNYTTGIMNRTLPSISFTQSDFITSGPIKKIIRNYSIKMIGGGTLRINATLQPTSSVSINNKSGIDARTINGAIISYNITPSSTRYQNTPMFINYTILNSGTTADSNLGAIILTTSPSQFRINNVLLYNGTLNPVSSVKTANGGYNITTYTHSSLASGGRINVLFNVTPLTLLSSSVEGNVKNVVKTSTFTPTSAPTYRLNISQIYNSTSSTIQIRRSDSVSFSIPVRIENIGNQDISSISVIARVNSQSLGTNTISSISGSNYQITSFTGNFETLGGARRYNLTINVSSSVYNTSLAKIINVSFTFNDTDNDRYYPTTYGGTDCNNNNNATTYLVGASCSRTGYTGSSYDSSCSCSGGSSTSSSGNSGGSNTIINTPTPIRTATPTPKPTVTSIQNNNNNKNENTNTESTTSNTPIKKYNFNGKVGNKYDFKIASSDHKIEIKSIGKNSAVVEIRSDPITLNITVGESKTLDLNNNTKIDTQVTLNSITNGTADIEISEIPEYTNSNDNAPEDSTKNVDLLTTGNVNNSLSKEGTGKIYAPNKKFTWLLWTIIVIGLCVLGYYGYDKYKKSTEHWTKNWKVK